MISMEKPSKKIFVMSGKGGVGKTTIAVNLAVSLALSGRRTGLLDVDIHGPNVPKMLGLEGKKVIMEGNLMLPIIHDSKLKVISFGFFINDNDSVIWRGPMKHNVIKQLIEEVKWGELEYLVIDFPPGTGDEQISTAQMIGESSGAIIVSTPQEVSILDSVRTIDFCRKMNLPIIGMIENMSGEVFGEGSIQKVAEENSVPYLGSLKMRKEVAKSGDDGKPFVLSESIKSDSFKDIANKVLAYYQQEKKDNSEPSLEPNLRTKVRGFTALARIDGSLG